MITGAHALMYTKNADGVCASGRYQPRHATAIKAS
jgi:hypothetical protein